VRWDFTGQNGFFAEPISRTEICKRQYGFTPIAIVLLLEVLRSRPAWPARKTYIVRIYIRGFRRDKKNVGHQYYIERARHILYIVRVYASLSLRRRDP